GELAAVFGSPFAVDPPPGSVAVDPTGLMLYAASSGPRPAMSMFVINEVVGALGARTAYPFEGTGAGHAAIGVDLAAGLVFLAEDLAGTVSLFRPARGVGGSAGERLVRASAG